MIGVLPKSLIVGGVSYPIRTDFRVVLNIFEALMDGELTDSDKALVCLKALFVEFQSIPVDCMKEAIEKTVWFMDGGDAPKVKADGARTFDWKHDEAIIFPAVNKVAGYETRSCEYLHWWSFLGFFNEIDEGLFSTVMTIRQKRAKGKTLEKWEKEIYKTHKDIINIYTEQEKAEIAETEAALAKLLGE